VSLVDSLGEHIGRYEHVFSEFARQGLLTVGYDTRGFGRSSGPRGGAPTLDELFDDIELVYNHARIAGVKTFLVRIRRETSGTTTPSIKISSHLPGL